MISDIFVVLLYVTGMLLLGGYAMRRARTREDYLVAGRNLGPGFYMATMSATVLGGASTIVTVRLGYVYGISGLWLTTALGLGIIGPEPISRETASEDEDLHRYPGSGTPL